MAEQSGWPVAPPARPVYVLASWGQRARALGIDALILLVPTLALWALLLTPIIDARSGELSDQWQRIVELEATPADEEAFIDDVLGLAVLLGFAALGSAWLLAGLYHAACMASTGGQTPGKRAAGIRVMRESGAPVTFAWGLWRALVAQRLLWLPLLLATAGGSQVAQYLWPLWDDQHRALHDFIAKSRVVSGADPLR